MQELLKAPRERGLGLNTMMDLGASYLRDRKLNEADAYFKDIASPKRAVNQYRTIGTFGQAMVLAYRDQPAESNKLFLETFEFLKNLEIKAEAAAAKTVEGKKPIARPNINGYWQQNVAWREQIAQALNRNFINAPDAYPADRNMELYRKPPIPNGKAGP